MKSTLLNRKLLALVVTALLLGALALVSPTQHKLSLNGAEFQIGGTYERFVAEPSDDPGDFDGGYLKG